MQIITAQLDWLVWDADKAGRFSNTHLSAMCRWMGEEGQYKPVVVDNRTCRVVAGLSVVEAARDMDWDEIEVAILDGTDECRRLVQWWAKWDKPFAMPEFTERLLDEALGAIPI